jgi:hypothetical protein
MGYGVGQFDVSRLAVCLTFASKEPVITGARVARFKQARWCMKDCQKISALTGPEAFWIYAGAVTWSVLTACA